MKTGSKRKSALTPALKVAMVLFLIPSFFCQTLVKNGVVQLVLVVFALGLIGFDSARKSNRIGLPACALLWGALIVFSILHRSQSDTIWKWALLLMCCLIAIGFLVHEDNVEWVRHVLKTISLLGCFYAAITISIWMVPDLYTTFIYPVFFSSRITLIGGMGYQSGFTAHYSTNAIYLALGLIASFYLIHFDKRRWRIVAFCIILFALLLTAKRAHLVFGLLSLLAGYLLLNNTSALSGAVKVAAAVIIALTVFAVLSFFIPDVALVADRLADVRDDDSFGGRSRFYEICLNLWLQSPLLGNGWGSFAQTLYATNLGAQYIARGFTTMSAHNVYLQMLAEQGLLGLVLMVLAMGDSIVRTVRGLRLPPSGNGDTRVLLAASFSIQLFFVLYCITGNPLYDMQMYVPYMIFAGAGISISRHLWDMPVNVTTLEANNTKQMQKHQTGVHSSPPLLERRHSGANRDADY